MIILTSNSEMLCSSSSVLSLSPSFNTYSSNKLADIAARVVEEFRAESNSDFDYLFDSTNDETGNDRALEENLPQVLKEEEEEEKQQRKSTDEVDLEEDEDEYDDDEFEFAFVTAESDSSTISADEIFYNGQIRPMFPIFNRDLLLGDLENDDSESSKPPTRSPTRFSLRMLLGEERDSPSSEAEELDRVPPGNYSVWTSKEATTGESPESRKESNSTGSSKRWKFRDLLHRSNSNGKDTFVFFTPSTLNSKKKDEKTDSIDAGKMKAKKITGREELMAAQYTRNSRLMKEGERKRSFLPYRQDLVGFFATVNGLMTKNLPTS
ncbi:unnamed protein product [Ilex paraguariensis]|uniref:Uncharacterized protein n=1 Tax=Ilex paraguariensis TaxID=185542 RepID=A0ABC8R0V0_9AQUA